jgi:hypothetical protein
MRSKPYDSRQIDDRYHPIDHRYHPSRDRYHLRVIATSTDTRRKRGPSLEAAFCIADGLGVELPELLGFKGLSGPGLEAARLVSSFRPKVRRAVLALLRGIAREEGKCSGS